tara:strand:+ start:586 stop:1035 length:450 start_codon:yes stop_codon:yes gene_type:complete
MDEEKDIYADDIEYKDEVNAFKRAGGYGSMLGKLIGPDGKPVKSIQDPLERFQIRVDAIARSMKASFPGNLINEESIQNMLEKAHLLEYVQYKNPTAYVLGYIASTGGKNLTPETFSFVEKKIEPLTLEGNIKSPDILRYARLWVLHLQ